MPKILKQGKQDTEMWPYTVTLVCRKCGCEFQLEVGDHWRLVEVEQSDYRGDTYTETHVALNCPNCKNEVTAR